MIWLLPDTHFGHARMQEYENRPIEFENKIIKNVSHMIHVDDVLIHLGDFCIGRDDYWHALFMESCKAKHKWLVRGNHDGKSMSWYLSHGWDFVGDEIVLNIYGKRVLLSHRPVDIGFELNVHGHHHASKHHPEDQVNDKHRLVFVEHDYAPISLRKIVEG